MGRTTKRTAKSVAADSERVSNLPLLRISEDEETDESGATAAAAAAAAAAARGEESTTLTANPRSKRRKHIDAPRSPLLEPENGESTIGYSKKSRSTARSTRGETISTSSSASIDPNIFSALQPPAPIPSLKQIKQQQQLQEQQQQSQQQQSITITTGTNKGTERGRGSSSKVNSSSNNAISTSTSSIPVGASSAIYYDKSTGNLSVLSKGRSLLSESTQAEARSTANPASSGSGNISSRSKSESHIHTNVSENAGVTSGSNGTSTNQRASQSSSPAVASAAAAAAAAVFPFTEEEIQAFSLLSEEELCELEKKDRVPLGTYPRPKPVKRKRGRPAGGKPKEVVTRGEPLTVERYQELISAGTRLLPAELRCWECKQLYPITDYSSIDLKRISRKCTLCLRNSEVKAVQLKLKKRQEKKLEKEAETEESSEANARFMTEMMAEMNALRERLAQQDKEKQEMMVKMNAWYAEEQRKKIVAPGVKSWEDVAARGDVVQEFNTRDHRMQVNGPDGMMDTSHIELPWTEGGKPAVRVLRGHGAGSEIARMRAEYQQQHQSSSSSTASSSSSSTSHLPTRTHSNHSTNGVTFPVSPINDPYNGIELPEGEDEDEEGKEEE